MANPQTLLYTAAVQHEQDEPNIKVPSAFGFALLSTPIVNGAVDFIWLFLNRTDAAVSVEWSTSHPFDVVLEDSTGQKTHLNDFMPAPSKNVPPDVVPAETQSYRV